MRKLVLLPLLFVYIFGCAVTASAQANRLQAREAEWKNYALPQANFARQIDPDKDLIFRVPADWKQEEPELIFNGPHSAKLIVRIHKVPDGHSLLDYFGGILQAVKDQPGLAEATVTRKTQLQDLEAREIFLETLDTEGEMFRSTTWITVTGPLAISFNLRVPAAHATEIEPFFKAVVQSVIFLSPDYPAFEQLRSAAIKTPAPGPIHEIESIVASLNEVNTDRQSAITRLTSLFSSHADVTIDLLLDRRPLVRMAAVEALAKTNNNALTPILWRLVDDDEPLVAEAAARVVANTPDVVAKTLQHSMFGFNTKTIARLWQFMAKDRRVELMQKIFSETAVSRPSPTPPPNKAPGKPRVKVAVTELVPIKPGQPPPSVGVAIGNDPNVQIGALTLLTSIPPEDFKLPLARVMAANYDPLVAMALQVANERREALPLDTVYKLVASSDKQISNFAAQNLAFSAGVADIPRIESLVPKPAADTKNDLHDELKSSVSKIRFRHELNAATTPGQRREIIRKAASDSSLANFAWFYDCEATISGCVSTAAGLKSDFTLKPFAENLLPKKLKHYTAIPDPSQLVQKFHATLHGMQLDSARAQSNFLLTMGVLRDGLALQLSAPPDAASLIEYTGIDPQAPIAFGTWTAEGALDSTSSAERSAIVLRVKDRARFERAAERLQRSTGKLTNLTTGIAIGSRLIAALPAILPFSAATLDGTSKPTPRPLLEYQFSGEKEWNGLRIKTIEQISVSSEWKISNASTYMTFIGDAVILTPDLATLRELLSSSDQPSRQYLADNTQFRKVIESRGDVIYFSDVAAVTAEAVTTDKEPLGVKGHERGAVNISGSSWENTHHIEFEESDWAKSLLQFDPKQLSAPRELLPSSTIAYYLMNIDLAGVWSSQKPEVLASTSMQALSNAWALDLKQEVLPELGPECGGVMLDLFDMETMKGGSFAVFCKLKSNKLAEALKTGKLFRGVGPVTDFAEIKVEDTTYFVAVRNGFLVAANAAKGLAALDGKSNLAATRDYSRAVEKVPGGAVAFGGYNLEAAVAATKKTGIEGPQAEVATLLFSLASAFHSQNFYATATSGSVSGRSSVAMDREGRYRVADISYLPRGTNITFVTLEPAGIPITDQNRMSSLVLKVHAKSPGPIDNIKDDIKTSDQTVEQKASNELLLTVNARRGGEKQVELPVKDPEFAQYVKATEEFPSENKEIKDLALQIAGTDRDAWSVARKLGDWVHKNLEWKKVVSATATQTLATREADCTEFSALFVTMARSLGLPARMVSGLAYSGKSFGGHAWVEVWAGKWIELDPTWGTDFVDATHIRDASSSLVMSAGLNLIELEVVDTKRGVEDFQKSPRALAQHLTKAIPRGDRSDVEAAIDLATLTDQFMGAGSWSKLTAGERDQMSSAYRRFMNEIIGGYGKSVYEMRLLYIDEKEDTAEATCLLAPVDMLLRLRLVRRNNVWHLVEVIQTDTAFHIASETLQPTIVTLEKTRAGQKAAPAGLSTFVRVLVLMNSDSAKTISVVDSALKSKPDDKGLLFLKAIELSSTEDRKAEGLKLLRELSDQGFVPAVFRLASELTASEDENEKKEGLAVFERYTSVEPRDPRGFSGLAQIYFDAKDFVKAEAAYRKVVELDPGDIHAHLSLIRFLVINDRIDEAKLAVVAGEKHQDADDDLFGLAVENLKFFGENKAAEKFAVSDPVRLKTSYQANFTLAIIYSFDERYAEALRAAEVAAQLDKEAAEPHVQMAMVYRKQSRWAAALKAAQRAIDLDDEYSEAYYQLACALTRMGRTKEALSALTKSVELDPDQVDYMVDEADLKALAKMQGFKKLIPEPAKQ